jgi:hypothetical protein
MMTIQHPQIQQIFQPTKFLQDTERRSLGLLNTQDLKSLYPSMIDTVKKLPQTQNEILQDKP